MQCTVFKVHDVLNYRIQEVAVVGDQQQGAGVVAQPVFQPEDGVQIQVVGRFVEQQQVGRAHQRLRQVQAHPPAAGEVADAAAALFGGEPQAGKQGTRAAVGAETTVAFQFGV